MTHTICRECETVSHCLKSGCVPIARNLDELEAIVLKLEAARPLVFPVIDGSLIQEAQ